MTANLITNFDWKEQDFSELRVLDLAAGSGRNGLWFAEKGAKVHFIDRDLSQMDAIRPRYPECLFSQWDMEVENAPILPPSYYDIVLVFNYLHRPLFPQITAVLKPGGVIFYETFTWKQAKIGRPKNPDFLLKTNELFETFKNWEAVHYFEGKIMDTTGVNESFKAQLISRKPRL